MTDPVTAAVKAMFALREARPDDDEPTFTVASVTDDVDRAKLPISPRRILEMVDALGWDVLALRQTVTHHPAELMQNDGKTGPKGTAKKPECDVKHIFLVSADATRKIAFEASWLDGRFEDVTMLDPLGIPVELYVDYKPTAERKKTLGADYAIEHGDRQDREYNDGMSWLAKRHCTRVSGEFNAWLNDWLAVKERKLNEPR